MHSIPAQKKTSCLIDISNLYGLLSSRSLYQPLSPRIFIFSRAKGTTLETRARSGGPWKETGCTRASISTYTDTADRPKSVSFSTVSHLWNAISPKQIGASHFHSKWRNLLNPQTPFFFLKVCSGDLTDKRLVLQLSDEYEPTPLNWVLDARGCHQTLRRCRLCEKSVQYSTGLPPR